MIQFNEQYIRDYLKPFLREVLTDMANADQPGGKPYLRKILNQEDLGDVDTKQFTQDYFLGSQPANRPFTSNEEEPHRQQFLQILNGHIDTMIRMSNKDGMRQAILPDAAEGRLFGSHQQLTINLNNLAITMARNFEKKAIQRKLKEEGNDTKENLKKNEDGELKLIQIDGKEQVKSDQELAEMAQKEPEKQIIPMIEPDIEQKMAARPLDETGDPEPSKPEVKTATVQQVHADTENSKIAAMKELLTASGLEVIGKMTIENGIIQGTVRDVNQQELKVTIDTKKPDYASDKFTFTFTEKGPNGDMKGKEIPVSRGDIRNIFFDQDGNRRSAETVFQEHDSQAQRAKEPFNPPKTETPLIRLPNKKPQGPPRPVEDEIVIPKQAIQTSGSKPAKIRGALVQKGAIPTIGLTAKVPTQQQTADKKEQNLKQTVKDAQLRGPQVTGAKATVQQKKKRLKEQREALAQSQKQTRGRRPTETERTQPQNKKKKGNWLAKLAIGVGTGSMGGVFYALWHTATS